MTSPGRFAAVTSCMDGRIQTTQVAIVAHTDCAGNRIPDAQQKDQLRRAIDVVSARFPQLEVIALFLDPRIGFQRIN